MTVELNGRQIHSLAALVKADYHPYKISGPTETPDRDATALISEQGEITFPKLAKR